MKKIAFFTIGLRRGGAERVVSNLCNTLIDDYQIYLILFNDSNIDYPIDKRVIIKKLAPLGDASNGLLKLLLIPYYALYLSQFVLKEKICILFSFLLRPNFISCIVKKVMGRRLEVIISERSNPLAQYSSESVKDKINRFLIKKLYPIADSITVNSYGSAQVLKKYYKINSCIEIIKNPITSSFFSKTIERSQKVDCFHFITVGRMDEGKNQIILLKALKELIKSNSTSRELKLSIIGDGTLRQELEEFCIENKIDKYVDFLGYQEDVEYYLKDSDCFIFSSNREGFPNVLIEAMAAKLPIISTDCSFGPREILTGKSVLPNYELDQIEVLNSGVLVPVNSVNLFIDAMKHVILNYNWFLEKIEANEVLLKDHNVNVIVDQYKSLFLENSKK